MTTGVEVHAVLRPLARRPGIGVCEGVSDGLSPRPFGDDAADWKMRAEAWRDRMR
jgi:hypothetical protein